LALPTVFACEKPDPIKGINLPAKIEATVPDKVYSSAKDIILDASLSTRLNGNGQLFFLWSCTKFPSGASPVISNASDAIAVIKVSVPGIYEISLKVWSTPDNVNTKTFTMEVIPETLTSAPVISPLPDMDAQLPDNYVKLNAQGNYLVTPAGRLLFFKWRIIEGPSTDYRPSLSQDSVSNTFLIVRAPGKYVIKLDVTNEINLTTSDSFVVNVIPDPLSGTEVIIDNLLWKLEDDGDWGPFSVIRIKETNTYRFRSLLNSTLSVWDEENQKWMDDHNFEWTGSQEGLLISAYLDLDGKKTKIKLKYL
jgi:hypothetical protein